MISISYKNINFYLLENLDFCLWQGFVKKVLLQNLTNKYQIQLLNAEVFKTNLLAWGRGYFLEL